MSELKLDRPEKLIATKPSDQSWTPKAAIGNDEDKGFGGLVDDAKDQAMSESIPLSPQLLHAKPNELKTQETHLPSSLSLLGTSHYVNHKEVSCSESSEEKTEWRTSDQELDSGSRLGVEQRKPRLLVEKDRKKTDTRGDSTSTRNTAGTRLFSANIRSPGNKGGPSCGATPSRPNEERGEESRFRSQTSSKSFARSSSNCPTGILHEQVVRDVVREVYRGYMTDIPFPDSMNDEARRVALSSSLEFLRDRQALMKLSEGRPHEVLQFLVEDQPIEFDIRVLINGMNCWGTLKLGVTHVDFNVLSAKPPIKISEKHSFNFHAEPTRDVFGDATEFLLRDPYNNSYYCYATSPKERDHIILTTNTVQPFALFCEDAAWKRSLQGWRSITSDGSLLNGLRKINQGKEYKSTIGGSIRLSNAELVLGFAQHINKKRICVIEGFGLLMLLILVILVLNGDRPLNLLVELDSLFIVTDLNFLSEVRFDDTKLRKKLFCPELVSLYKMIGSLLVQLDDYVIRYIPREGNTFADWCTRLAHLLGSGEMMLYYTKDSLLSKDKEFALLSHRLLSDDLFDKLKISQSADPEFQFELKKVKKSVIPDSLEYILHRDKINSAKYGPRQRDELRNNRRRHLCQTFQEMSVEEYLASRELEIKKINQVMGIEKEVGMTKQVNENKFQEEGRAGEFIKSKKDREPEEYYSAPSRRSRR